MSQISRLSALFSETCRSFFEDFEDLLLLADLDDFSDLDDLPDTADFSDLPDFLDFCDFSDLAERDSDFREAFDASAEEELEEILAEGELAEAASAFMGAVNNIHATATASMEGQREYFMIIPWLLFEAVRGANGPRPWS